jgi:hypothetical protein
VHLRLHAGLWGGDGVRAWPVCLAAAAVAFAGAAWATQGLEIELGASAAAAAACLVITYLLLPRPVTDARPMALPWWDIPARMLATVVLVGGISIGADALGPQLSGIVSTYPAIVTVIGSFTHHQWGRDAVRHMLRGLALSLLAFVMFFLAVGATLAEVGVMAAFVLGTAAALPVSATVLALNRWMGPR